MKWKKKLIDKFKNPDDAWLSLEQFVFIIIAGTCIFVFYETEWRWRVIIILNEL